MLPPVVSNLNSSQNALSVPSFICQVFHTPTRPSCTTDISALRQTSQHSRSLSKLLGSIDNFAVSVLGSVLRHGPRPCATITGWSFFHCNIIQCYLNSLLQIPYQRHLADQFSSAYDCYLEICCAISSQAEVTLGYSPESWLTERICPPCLYKTDAEPALKFSLLATMDGNNSLKLFDPTFHSGVPLPDDRLLSKSSRWLTDAQVDRFKDEVSQSHIKVVYVSFRFCKLPILRYLGKWGPHRD